MMAASDAASILIKGERNNTKLASLTPRPPGVKNDKKPISHAAIKADIIIRPLVRVNAVSLRPSTINKPETPKLIHIR